MTPTATLCGIRRYVVKGLSAEPLSRVTLTAGAGIPEDRRYAVALPDTRFDTAAPTPLAKTHFAVLMRSARLAEVSSTFDTSNGELRLHHAGQTLATGVLSEVDGRAAIEQALVPFVHPPIDGGLRIVQAEGHRFTDVSVVSPEMMQAISFINLETVRAIERDLDAPVDARRFRGNLLIDGLPAWAEFDWLDHTLDLGGVRLQVVSRTRRCAATEVNPDTAERDIALPKELLKRYGHADVGIYATVQSSGQIAVGDTLSKVS